MPSDLTAFEGVLYFRATDGATGDELWRTDGTEAGTVRIKDILPGPNRGLSAIPSFAPFFAPLGSALYFAANDGTNGSELWRTDGTDAGTVLVADIASGPNGSGPFGFAEFGGALYFRATDQPNGTELWRTDGTGPGTVLVKDIVPGIIGGLRSIPEFTEFDGTLYFSADNGTNGLELWKTDGTDGGTVLVKDIQPGALDGIRNEVSAGYTVFNGALYFAADDGTSGREFWVSDGSDSGTMRVKDISAGQEASDPAGFIELDGMLYFSAEDETNGRELWRSDGTESGTERVRDIRPGADSSEPADFTVLNGLLYFTANDGTNGRELWRTDGTEAGTVLVKDIHPTSSGIINGPSYLTEFEGSLYFRANDGTSGLELWSSDGTEVGTVRVADINPGSGAAGAFELTVASGSLYFRANDGTNGQELWVLPGTNTSGETRAESISISLSVFPNPVRSSATLRLSLARRQSITVAVVDALGREAVTLHDGPLSEGRHTLEISSAEWPSGIYVARVQGDGEEVFQRLTVIR